MKKLAVCLLCSTVMAAVHASPEDADMKALRAASCEDLGKEYREALKAEREIQADMKKQSRQTTGTNLLGLATLATVGVGFFSWHDASDHKELLEEVDEYKAILKQVAGEKKCALPAQ